MVGRSKPQARMERKPSVDFNAAEIRFLKAKNLELAKALADSKAQYTQMVEDRGLIQRELFRMNLRCTKLENYIKNMESASRACMSSIVMASNHATDLLQNAHNALRLKIGLFQGDDSIHIPLRNSFNGSAHSSPSSNKTQAVKPMIDGHVILRPTINLRRVNEIPIEEIQRLQSGQPTNRNSSENNISTRGENENQDDSATRGMNFRNLQPVETVVVPFRNNELLEDEFTDHTSESDPPSDANNGLLDTVQEEQEDELTRESRLNSLANTSGNSLNLTGSGSQVPLLSGVFRDVRVYLSPMQNVAQYLDPRQHVTTERGSSKAHRSNRSHSMHSMRSTETRPKNSSSSAENRRPSAATSSAHNESNSNASLADSFSASLENSLLSSTKINSPNLTSRTDDLNWIGGSGGSNTRNSPRIQTFANSSNGLNSKYGLLKQRQSQNRLLTRTPDTSTSVHAGNNSRFGPSTSNYDPLEGPSSLLDSSDAQNQHKIETMSGLGLTPTFLDTSKKTPQAPPSPARTVLQRREHRKSDEKLRKSLFVTKKSSIEKKKAGVVSTKVAKIVVKRVSLTKNRLLGSPPRKKSLSPRKSLEGSRRGSSLDSLPKRKSLTDSPKTEKKSSKEEDKMNSSIGSASSASSTSMASSNSWSLEEKRPPKKRGRKSKKELSELEASKSHATTPRKRGRPKRAVAQQSLKEPSLRKKMRRSK